MALSGETATYSFDVQEALDMAAGRAGIAPELMSAEIIQRSIRLANMMLSEFPNYRIQSWSVQQVFMPLYLYQANLVTPDGTVNILNVNLRTPARLAGTYASSAGGVVANAFDSNFETILTQAAPNGNVSIQFITATAVQSIGLLWGTVGSFSVVLEFSNDGITWYQVDATQSITAIDRQWTWFEVDGGQPALYYRIRETAGGTLVLRELVFGNTIASIPIPPLSRDDYYNMPASPTPGRPSQYWLDRQRRVPVMRLWPATGSGYAYSYMQAARQAHLQQINLMMNDVDVPYTWYEFFVAEWAARICEQFEEAKKDRLAELQTAALGKRVLAASEDRDASPITIKPFLNGYFYGR